MAKIKSKKTSYYGNDFDSKAEGEFYLLLRSDKNVKAIELQPQYTLLSAFSVPCYRCEGNGKVENKKTLRMNKCTLCSGTGKRMRQPWKYTADFKVTYKDGKEEVIDVKGYANERFPLREIWGNKLSQIVFSETHSFEESKQKKKWKTVKSDRLYQSQVIGKEPIKRARSNC